ncbi:MAG: 7-cyano-7-deazaguanine synthase QueC [Thermoplasmatota archaeon]
MARKAVVLLSGGLDSCVAAAMAKSEGSQLVALSFDYAQRHRKELLAARKVARALGARHVILKVPINKLGHSALTDRSIPVPDTPERLIGSRIPSTYVPARNTIFLAFALGLAEVEGADTILLGANAVDYSGYPDCRPEYLAAFEAMANLATKAGVEGKGVKLKAPLLHMSKQEIVRAGFELNAPLHLTWSCYRGGAKACGRCESCRLRKQGFALANRVDPIPYEPGE